MKLIVLQWYIHVYMRALSGLWWVFKEKFGLADVMFVIGWLPF